jgi:hypothetical protein
LPPHALLTYVDGLNDVIKLRWRRSTSAIPDLEPIHPGVSDLNRETPFGNSTRILSVVVGAPALRGKQQRHLAREVLTSLLLPDKKIRL